MLQQQWNILKHQCSSSDGTPVTQSYEDRMHAHANVYSMHGHYLNNLKETQYKIKSTHNNK